MLVYDLDALGVQHGHLFDKFNKLIAVASVDGFNDFEATVQRIGQEFQDLKKKQRVVKGHRGRQRFQRASSIRLSSREVGRFAL